MKSIIAAKMSAMRKLSALSSSANSTSETAMTKGGNPISCVPKEPSYHHGEMLLSIGMGESGGPQEVKEEYVDVVFCIALDSVYAVTEVDSTIVFEADFTSIKEIVWDYTDCSVCFYYHDGAQSPSFVFISSLIDLETQLTSALRALELPRAPDHVYVGVLVGRNSPSSPIQQRRASMATEQTLNFPAPRRRELLSHERPPRNITSREKLAMQYFKTGVLSFPCSINNEARGLKLDGDFLYVFPSSDCFDRSACLFSYQYDQVDSCEVRGGTRLELRFHRSGAKQPTFIAFQSPDTQHIRDAIWFFHSGMSLDQYYRRTLSVDATLSPQAARRFSNATVGDSLPASPRVMSTRRASLKSFRDQGALLERVHSRCVVIGCIRRYDGLKSSAPGGTYQRVEVCGSAPERRIWYCDEHAMTAPRPGSPPRSPSKRSGLIYGGKSSRSMAHLIHKGHYARSVKYHDTLLKSGGKYQLTKTWNQKIVALIETPVGGFLVYYDKLSHCPGLPDTSPKERRVIDLSSVVCVRRVSYSLKGPTAVPFAFDIVTIYRTWTFAATNLQEHETWLGLLTDLIEQNSSMTPDKPLRFPVRCLRDPLRNIPSRNDGTTTLEVSSNGLTVCSGTEGESEVYNWYFTEIQKWSVAKQQDGTSCCFLCCALSGSAHSIDQYSAQSASCSQYQDFLFQSSESEAICSVIEFFVGKCMAKLEILGIMNSESQPRKARTLSLLARPVVKAEESDSAADEQYKRVNSDNCHVPAAVSLEPLGLERLPVAESAQELVPIFRRLKIVVPEINATDIEIFTGEECEQDIGMHLLLPDQCVATEVDGAELTEASLSTPAERHHTNSPQDGELERVGEPLHTVHDELFDFAEGNDPLALEHEVEPPTHLDENSAEQCEELASSRGDFSAVGIDSSERNSAGLSCIDSVDRFGSDNMERDAQLAGLSQSATLAAVSEIAFHFEDDPAKRNVGTDSKHLETEASDGDADSDRFVSFEFCDYSMNVDDETSCNSQGCASQDVDATCDSSDEDEDQDFEDAHCELLDRTESSVAILDDTCLEDEDSLIVLEFDDSTDQDLDAAGDVEGRFDSVDEINTSSPKEQAQRKEIC